MSVEIITMFVYLFVAFALVIVAIPQWQADPGRSEPQR